MHVSIQNKIWKNNGQNDDPGTVMVKGNFNPFKSLICKAFFFFLKKKGIYVFLL